MSIAAAVFQAEERLARAHETMDLAIIAELLHPNYVMLQPNGQVENRQDILDSYRSGKRHWDMARVGDMTVRLAGETATVTGRWRCCWDG